MSLGACAGWKEMYAEADGFGLGDPSKTRSYRKKFGEADPHASSNSAQPADGYKAARERNDKARGYKAYATDASEAKDVYGSPQLQVYNAIIDILDSEVRDSAVVQIPSALALHLPER